LDEAGFPIGEMREQTAEEVGRRNEITVKDRDELTVGGRHRIAESTGFVTLTDLAADHIDPDSFRSQLTRNAIDEFAGFIGRVIEDLDLMEMMRVIKRSDSPDRPLGDIEFVVERELGGDFREICGFSGGMGFIPDLFQHVAGGHPSPWRAGRRE
jgi:hypothetical protein